MDLMADRMHFFIKEIQENQYYALNLNYKMLIQIVLRHGLCWVNVILKMMKMGKLLHVSKM